jgi:hypothetical protein
VPVEIDAVNYIESDFAQCLGHVIGIVSGIGQPRCEGIGPVADHERNTIGPRVRWRIEDHNDERRNDCEGNADHESLPYPHAIMP